jgi:hypothetical protein
MAERVYLGGVTNTTLHLESDGTMHIEEKQDAAPALDFAAACRNNRFDANACDGVLRHVAEVPVVEYLKWCREAGCAPYSREADIVLEKKLQDPANCLMLAAPKLRDPRIVMRGLR